MQSEPDLKVFSKRLEAFSKELVKLKKGCLPFKFDKWFNPKMTAGDADKLSIFEKLEISDYFKNAPKDAILETMMLKLEEARDEKDQDNKEAGEEFAKTLTTGMPDFGAMGPGGFMDYGDYGEEDFSRAPAANVSNFSIQRSNQKKESPTRTQAKPALKTSAAKTKMSSPRSPEKPATKAS